MLPSGADFFFFGFFCTACTCSSCAAALVQLYPVTALLIMLKIFMPNLPCWCCHTGDLSFHLSTDLAARLLLVCLKL